MLNRHYNTPLRKSFHTPTRLYGGVDARLDVRRLLPEGPVVLVADERFVQSEAATALQAAHVVVVRREPREEDLAEHLVAASALKPAAVVALGGGSAIDSAKAVFAEVAFGTFRTHDRDKPVGAPALVAIPTTAGSGSETSRFFIVADRAGIKQSYRSWAYAPDVAILDPVVLRDSGEQRLVLGAFDAFMHLWETYVCRNERDPVVQLLALEGIPLIARALAAIEAGTPLSDEHLIGLQRASAFGGMSIANVRTGLIHTLGESLAPQVPLSHPETIYLFFEPALAQYESAIGADIRRMDQRLQLGAGWSFATLRAAWRRLFQRYGVEARIQQAISATPVDLTLFLETVARDAVLLKENPAPITATDIAALADRALRGTAAATR